MKETKLNFSIFIYISFILINDYICYIFHFNSYFLTYLRSFLVIVILCVAFRKKIDFKTIATLFMEYKPQAFFYILSILCFIISLILGIPVVSEYFKIGLVPIFPTLIVSCIALMVALLLSTTGIILQVIVKKLNNYMSCI